MGALHTIRRTFPILASALFACAHAEPVSESSTSKDEIALTRDEISRSKIEVQVVDEQAVEDSLVTSGRITFDDLRVAHIYSPVTGRVMRLDAALGQRVKKGASLAAITSPDLGQASSDLGKANADLIASEHDYKRKKSLFEAHATSAADYEASRDSYRQAKAEKARAEQKAALLRTGAVDLVTQSYTLITPIDGEIIARMVNPGTEVQGQYSSGSAVELFTVGDLDKVWVMADVYEKDIARVVAGAKVTVTVVGYPGKLFQGGVDWVSGTLDPTTRTGKVRCVFDNPERLLKPEMYASVQIAVAERRALAVPRSAVVHLGDQSVVFVQSSSSTSGPLKFERVPVAADETLTGRFVPVSRGLERGAKVVVNGAQALAAMM